MRIQILILGLKGLMIPCGMVSKLSDLTKTVGTLRSDDRDRNENVKKALGFIIKTTTLHMLHGFW